MALPIFKSDIQELMLMETKWASQLNPILGFAPNTGFLLSSIPIVTGANVINHKLARKMQGWIISDIDASVTLYRSAAFNDKTLTLTSSGDATINLWVF